MSYALAAIERPAEAAAVAQEALVMLAPFVERYPGTYAGLARTIATDLLRYSQAGGVEPDRVLLRRVAQVLGADDTVAAAGEPATPRGKKGKAYRKASKRKVTRKASKRKVTPRG